MDRRVQHDAPKAKAADAPESTADDARKLSELAGYLFPAANADRVRHSLTYVTDS